MKRRAAAAALILVTLTGCGAKQKYDDERGRGDAPVSGRTGDDTAAFCTNMPDNFGNVCGKCVAHFPPYAMVVTTNTDYAPSNLVLFQAPEQCGGKAVSGAPPVISSGHAVKPPEDNN